MEWSTEVKIPESPDKIAHGMPVVTIGSCFSDAVGNRLRQRLFDVQVNPLGTLYNPLSIADALERAINGYTYTSADLFEARGMWHCLDFHSAFSRTDRTEALDGMNSAIAALHDALSSLRVLMITFGSAHAFVHKATGRVAGNCHKLPPSEFSETDIPVNAIANRFTALVKRLQSMSPGLTVIFTVSPIRHKAYGFHADKLSKARLLLATEEICAATGAHYFPAYEIMNDELRDYRFYAADMIHPSETAADHIFDRFAQTYFTAATRTLAASCLNLTRRLAHRPMAGDCSGEYARFAKGTLDLAEELTKNHPELTDAINRVASGNPIFQ